MTTGAVQSRWQQFNGTQMLVLTRESGQVVALSIGQVYQILNPVVVENGSYTYLVNVTDATSPEAKQALYLTQNPRFAENAYHMTYNELVSIAQTGAPVIQALLAQNTQTQGGASGINVAGAMTGVAGVARLGASSVNNITGGANQFARGINGFQNAEDIADLSRAAGQLSNGLNRFDGLANKGNAAVDATQSTDDRNFFLSAGNWLDNSLFGSIADMMPIDMLKKAFKMVGGCFSGLFKTIGYMVEGEWDKVGSVGLNWLKDAAITGALTYGAYYLGKEFNLFGTGDEKTTTSSSSGNSNSNSQTVDVSVSKDASLSLEHRPSSNSTPVGVLDQAGKIITTGNSHLSRTSTILNEDQSSTVFQYQVNQKVDSK